MTNTSAEIDENRKLYFWQNMPTHIQSYAIAELKRRWDGEIHCVWDDQITEDRRELQWTEPALPGVQQHYLDTANRESHAESIVSQNTNAIHIFSGLNAYPGATHGLTAAEKSGVHRIGIMAEPGIRLGWRGMIRPIRAKWLASRSWPFIFDGIFGRFL